MIAEPDGVLGIVALCLYSTWPSALMLPSTVGPRHLPGFFVALASVLATRGFRMPPAGASPDSPSLPRGAGAGLPSTAPGIVASDGRGRLGDVLGAAWDSPPAAPHARKAERLLRRLPGRRAAVLLTPDAQVEALLRARTANALAITHPVSESVFGQTALDRLEPSIRGMPACTPLITQIDLGSAVLASPITPGLAVPALEQVGDAFRLEQVRVRRSGLVTSRLVPARAGPRFSCPPLP